MFTKEHVKKLKDLVETELDVKIRSYSGRSMYGRECLGIETYVHDGGYSVDVFTLGLLIGSDEGLLEEFIGEDVRTDSMGRGQIIYWPNIKANGITASMKCGACGHSWEREMDEPAIKCPECNNEDEIEEE